MKKIPAFVIVAIVLVIVMGIASSYIATKECKHKYGPDYSSRLAQYVWLCVNEISGDVKGY